MHTRPPTPWIYGSAVLMLCCSGTAFAQDTPPLTWTAAYTVQSNKRTDLNGPGSSNDDYTWGKSELGVQFHTIQSLQQFQLDARVANYQYGANNQPSLQNHNEVNYAAAWQWAITPRLRGNLNATQVETPTVENGPTGAGIPNRQTRNNYRADADYEVLGPWHAVAGISRDQTTSEFVNSDTRSDTRDLGVRYNLSSGSWLKYSLRTTDGNYLAGNYQSGYGSNLAPTPFNEDSYQQREQDLRAHWAVSVASSLDANITQVERRHQRYTGLNFDGRNYGVDASWAVTGRSTVVMGYARTLGVVVVPVPLYTEQDSVSLGWNWVTSSRTQVRVRQALSKIDYRVQPGIDAGLRSDTSHDTSLSLVWSPGNLWQISAALAQQAHSAGLYGQDYTNQQVSLTAQLSY